MPYCVKCGQKVEGKDSFCGTCGQKLPSVDGKRAWSKHIKSIRSSRFLKPALYVTAAIVVLTLFVLVVWPGISNLLHKQAYIESLDATVVDLKLFEAGIHSPSVGFRRYDTTFSKATSRYIYWELSLEHSTRDVSQPFRVTSIFYYPDGSMMGEASERFIIDAGLSESVHSWGFGWSEPGHWIRGEHSVEIIIDEQVVASRSFEIN